jgi:hypothetical protein
MITPKMKKSTNNTTIYIDDTSNRSMAMSNRSMDMAMPNRSIDMYPQMALSAQSSQLQIMNVDTDNDSETLSIDAHDIMRKFLNPHGGCFNGEAIVLLANGKTKCVKDLRKGDQLHNQAIVQCLIEESFNKKSLKSPSMCDIHGVLFTPYHPICLENQWYFPIDLVQPKPVAIDSWFNLILKDEVHGKYEVEFENGIKAITLGHYRKENKILEHPYFGTDLVLKDLQERDASGFSNGYIHIQEINYHQLQFNNDQYCINYYKISTDINNDHHREYNDDDDDNKIMETQKIISEIVF